MSRLIYPHDSPKNQMDGSTCTLKRLRSSALLAVTADEAREAWEWQHTDPQHQDLESDRLG